MRFWGGREALQHTSLAFIQPAKFRHRHHIARKVTATCVQQPLHKASRVESGEKRKMGDGGIEAEEEAATIQAAFTYTATTRLCKVCFIKGKE